MTRAAPPTETQDCYALTEWLELQVRLGRVRCFSHVPQETYTKSWAVKTKNRRMGVRKGVPDYLVVIPTRATRHQLDGTTRTMRLLFVEMKRKNASPSDTSPEQLSWIAALGQVAGVEARVCKGYDEAVAFIEREIQTP